MNRVSVRPCLSAAMILGLLAGSGRVDAQELTEAEREQMTEEAKRLNAEGVQLYRHDKIAEAVEKMQAALALRKKLYPETTYPDGHRELAQSLNNLGSLFQAQRSYEQARPYYEQALAMRRKLYPESKYPDGHSDLAYGLNNLGFVLEAQGSYERARPYLEQALEMRRKLYPESRYPNGHPELTMSLINLGTLLKDQGSYERARPYFEQALAMQRKLYPESRYPDGHPDLAVGLNNLGSLLEDHGSFEEARPYLEQALAMRRKLYPESKYPDGHADLATSLNNLGCLLKDQGEYKDAQPCIEQALAMLRKLFPEPTHPEGHPYLAYSLNNLGCLLEVQGSYEQARPYYEEALAMRRKLYPESKFPGGHPDLAQSLHSLGFLQARGSYEQARPYLEQALAMRRKLYPPTNYPDGHPELVQSLDSLGLLVLAQGSYEQARPYYEEALTMKRKLTQRVLLLGSEAEALAQAQVHLLARDGYLSVAGHFPDAITPAYQAVWDSKSAVTRVFELRHAMSRAAGTKAPDQFARLKEVRRRIEQLVHEPSPRAEERGHEQTLFTERDQLQRELATAFPILGRWQERDGLSPGDLAKALPPGSAFIDLVAYNLFEQDPEMKGKAGMKLSPHYLAFVAAPGRPLGRVELGPAEPIDAAIRSWRMAIEQRQNADLEALRTLVWVPLAKQLPPGTKTLYVAPDGDLARLPWAALPVGAGRVLLEEYAVAAVTHGPHLLDQLRHPPEYAGTGSVLTVGDLAYGETDWRSLPGSRAEVDAIASLAPASPVALLNAEATAARLKESLPKARYAHFATHVEFKAEEPAAERKRQIESLKAWQEGVGLENRRFAAKSPLSYIGLVLSNGNVFGGQSLLDLPLENLRLVTLSASETGLGEYTGGEAIQELQRAFHFAGCANVVASLWKVNDAATAALMAKFYHELWVNKKPPIQALREAQLTIYRRPDLIPDLAGERGAAGLKEALAAKSTEAGAIDPKRHADTKLWAAFMLSGAGP